LTFRTVLSHAERVAVGGQGRPIDVVERAEGGDVRVDVRPIGAPGETLAERYYAVVAPFDTLRDEISLADLQARWQGKGDGPLHVSGDPGMLSAILGPFEGSVVPAEELLQVLSEDRKAVGILPFDQLDPRFKVLAVDGVNVLSNRLEPSSYPLAVALKLEGEGAETLLQTLENTVALETNRDPGKLTSLIMTGVTAMSRDTALRMEQKGVLYPTLVISDTLAAADITHVSNEIPFLDDCKVNATPDNLVLCSDTTYWKALEAIGTDIVGLSGNHVNDFGYDGARRSLQFYRDNKIPIFGSGLNVEEACAPLMWEHNGNTFAFVAALAWWPESAWASDKLPGACYYYDNKDRIKAIVQDLSQKVDVVAVELQHYESYEPFPTAEQVTEFREIRDWGADIVTGVQSHVPQAMEPYGAADPGGPGIIVYGLGNLFFDQMWSWETRTELYARHSIYDGRLISTEILTGVLEDYAQPRWASLKERAEILNRIFNAAPKRP
jgi:Bacterial capsule synthesis protein PGA_cap